MNNKGLMPNPKYTTFLQDSAPVHTKSSVIKKIKATFPNVWKKGLWPGNSPDLNVIEQEWSKLQESVFEKPVPNNRQELIERVKKTWYSLDISYLQNLVCSFPKRIDQVINNNGGSTDY